MRRVMASPFRRRGDQISAGEPVAIPRAQPPRRGGPPLVAPRGPLAERRARPKICPPRLPVQRMSVASGNRSHLEVPRGGERDAWDRVVQFAWDRVVQFAWDRVVQFN